LSQDNGAQVAIQTIYRELDRARTLINKHAKRDDDHTDEFEEDWTMIEDEDEVDVAPFEAQQAVTGMTQDASRTGGGPLVLGSMVMRGTQKRHSESADK
jgi:sterol 3beta-glucosyltransferase